MSSKLREELKCAVATLEEICDAFKNGTEGPRMWEVNDVITEAKAALAEPLRNCEVGTAEEQFKRHSKWCTTTRDFSCADTMCRKCFADWSQMPYKKEGEE